MVKPIYCNLLLIFSCLTYETYGNHHTRNVRNIRMPSHIIPNNIHPYDSSSSSKTINDAEKNTAILKSAAQPSSPHLLKKSFSSNDTLGHDRNRRSIRDNKSQSSMNSKQNQNYMDSNDLNNGQMNNDMISNFSNDKPLSGLDNSNDQNYDPSIQNRKNKSYSSNNVLGYDRNRRSVQDIKFRRRMNRRMTSPKSRPLRSNLRKSMRNTEQPIFVTTSNGDNDFIMNKLMNGKLNSFRLHSFNRFGDSFNEDSNTQETVNPKNKRLGSTGYLTIFPSFGSSNGIGMLGKGIPDMGSEKLKPNYQYSKPIGLSENDANKIRNDVLQKSNFYRNKFGLIPFTLDDQLNNCAQDWANTMAKQNIFNHRPDNVYGENLYGSQDLKNLGETAVDSWYNEMSLFTTDNEENVNTFHMTQLLWKKSTKLGVGIALNTANGMYYVVANYDPRGNLLNHIKENLPEITKKDIEEAKEAEERLNAKFSEPVVTSWSSS